MQALTKHTVTRYGYVYLDLPVVKYRKITSKRVYM